MDEFTASWIWAEEEVTLRNSFVRFRKTFEYDGGIAKLKITADSRYVLYVNGEYVGQGPVRCWPAHYRYDEYDLEPVLNVGQNVIAVLVNHFGESTFQYIPGPSGLLAELTLDEQLLITDESWKAQPDKSFVSVTPRICVQEAFEEQYDAQYDGTWHLFDYNDTLWSSAVVMRPALDGVHAGFAPSDIPFLTAQPITPKRFVSAERVRSLPHIHIINCRAYLDPNDTSSNPILQNAFLVTQIWTDKQCDVRLVFPHKTPKAVKLNGKIVYGYGYAGQESTATLKPGYNSLVMSIQGCYHLSEFSICIDGPENLRFSCTADELGAPWAIIGPFAFDEDVPGSIYTGHEHTEASRRAKPTHASATEQASQLFWDNPDIAKTAREPYFHQVRLEHTPETDVFLQAYTDTVVPGTVDIQHSEGFVSANDWVIINPPTDGSDARILLDFGHEVLAYHTFEIEADEGVIIDFHNFEFIQPDGLFNFAEGMNNSFRYICREGRQSYRSYLRRGFEYSYLIIRKFTDPVRIRGVKALFSTYPQSNRGNFTCSDTRLDKIWQAGALSMRCCSEDTYTDCPTYEQTHWVGDARNEALVDWTVNGNPKLWFRCIEQVGDSLDRSPITESQVPSGWQNILPAWTFLWMRSCKEYVQYSGDTHKGHQLLEYLKRNTKGFLEHLDELGLFDIVGWNMFDWADMDTPTSGVVTHQNCLAVHGFKDAAELAGWLGRNDLKLRWLAIASELSHRINEHLWNEEKQAYTDCLHDGRHSDVYSQQTQTAAYISGVATGDRLARCREIMSNPPEGFVKAGSPFFEFFLLEAMCREGKSQEMLDIIQRDWGFMVDMGATTFWEMWTARMGEGRLTRSHCHGWSAAPTFFLSSYVLGIRPGGAGYKPAMIEPRPGNLTWCRGTVPTPQGDISVQWENYPDKPFLLKVKAPENVNFVINLPREGTVVINGVEVS